MLLSDLPAEFSQDLPGSLPVGSIDRIDRIDPIDPRPCTVDSFLVVLISNCPGDDFGGPGGGFGGPVGGFLSSSGLPLLLLAKLPPRQLEMRTIANECTAVYICEAPGLVFRAPGSVFRVESTSEIKTCQFVQPEAINPPAPEGVPPGVRDSHVFYSSIFPVVLTLPSSLWS